MGYAFSQSPSLEQPAITFQDTSLEVVDYEPERLQLAHHGVEGSNSVLGTAVTGSQVLTLQGEALRTVASDSLWGTLLLSMAYQRDTEIQKYARRLGKVNTLTLLSVAGISGLGLAQSIVALNNTRGPQTLDVVSHHGPHGDHVHTEGDSKAPATLGVIGSSATLLTIGAKTLMDRHNGKRLNARQEEIKTQVAGILTRLRAGEGLDSVQAQLTDLVGPLATEEFAAIWRATHP